MKFPAFGTGVEVEIPCQLIILNRRLMQGEMNSYIGILPTRQWIYVASIFLLKMQISSAGDTCPPPAKLDPCICYNDPQMRARFQTTPIPITVTSTRLIVEGSLLKQDRSSETEVVMPGPELKDGTKPRSIEEGPSPEGSLGKQDRSSENEVVISNPELKDDTKPGNTEERSSPKFPLPPANPTCCTVVTCSAPKSLFILEDAVANALSRKWVDKIIVTHLPPKKGHTLVRLPRGWLKMLRVKHFEIRDTLLSGDFIHYGSPFEGQEQSMLWFSARNCYLSGSLSYETVGTVNTKGLNYMPKIEGVDFSRNHLVYISNTAFRYPPTNLSTVILSYNSIQGIESSTFHYSPFLKRVDLSNNQLENIYRNIFASPSKNLQNIDLSWNMLKTIPADLFAAMPHLKAVILANNFLTSLPAQPWAAVWRQLLFVDISNNFVQCDCSMTWLLPILSPPVINVSTTPTPQPLSGQLVLGSCSFIQPNSVSRVHKLISLTRSSLNCQ